MDNTTKMTSIFDKIKKDKTTKVKRRLLKLLDSNIQKKDFNNIIEIWLDNLFYLRRLESIKYYFKRNKLVDQFMQIRAQLLIRGYDDQQIGRIVKEFNQQNSNVFFHDYNIVTKFILEDLLIYATNFKSKIQTDKIKRCKTKKDSFFDGL